MKSDTTFRIETLRTIGDLSGSVNLSSEHDWSSTCDRTISSSCFDLLRTDSALSVCANQSEQQEMSM
jgi:hypothetical protein